MAVIKWDPLSLARAWGRLPVLDEEGWLEADEGLSVYETDNEVVVEANVPGVKPKEVDISLEGRTLTIKAEHKETREEREKKKVVYHQARQARYIYSTTIPYPVEAGKVEAVLKNGVLTITLPKAEEARPKKIAVKAREK